MLRTNGQDLVVLFRLDFFHFLGFYCPYQNCCMRDLMKMSEVHENFDVIHSLLLFLFIPCSCSHFCNDFVKDRSLRGPVGMVLIAVLSAKE